MLERFRDIVDARTTYGPYERHELDGFDRKPGFVWVAAEASAFDVLALFGDGCARAGSSVPDELIGIHFDVLEALPGRFHVTDALRRGARWENPGLSESAASHTTVFT